LQKQRTTQAKILSAGASLSLRDFSIAAWPVLEPGNAFRPNWHIDVICEHLEAVSRGEIRNLVINMPPRHMKSLLVCVFWPCWEWTRFPERRWIFASYSSSLSTRDSLKCRQLIQSPWYQGLYGDVFALSKDQNQKRRFDNNKTGYRIATSVGGFGTGEGGDRIVVDDPINAKLAESKAVRDGAIFWWDGTMSTRVNDPKTAVKIIVMQRLHEDDLTGHVLAQGGYEHLVLPAEYEGKFISTSLGWTDPRTKIGELLHGERFGPKEIEELKLRLGSRGTAGQLQQRPAPAEGAIFKIDWFKNRFRTFPEMTRVATFWDTALKAKEENDETAYVTVGSGKDGNLYVLRSGHKRWETPELTTYLCHQASILKQKFGEKYQGDYVEDRVSGTTLVQYVKRSRPEITIIPLKVERDKIARAHGITPLCESGRVIFADPEIYPDSRTMTDDLINALLTFPTAKHDDLTDAFVYAVKWFVGKNVEQKVSRFSRYGGMV
jgi:predicted phage terminase large subunit-like protein